MIANELADRLKHSCNDDFIFKIEFEKAFDLVLGVCLEKTMLYVFGFGYKLMKKIDLEMLITITTTMQGVLVSCSKGKKQTKRRPKGGIFGWKDRMIICSRF